MSEQRERCVLAYSGGLDTSICIKWLIDEKNLDVIAVMGDVGQQHDDVEKIKARAKASGAIDCLVVDMCQEYADGYLTYALAANAMYENKYPLLSALSRPLISRHLVEIAHEYGAKYIAHGCTGKGNDQVRFETCVMTLDPDIQLIAPVREWDLHTRDEEIDWAAEHGIEVPVTKKSPYSIDDNLWGRAIECGVLEDPWVEPPADIWTMTDNPEDAPDVPQYVEVEFKNGIPVAVDGKQDSYLNIIYKMNEISKIHGYGRIDMIENRLVGVKSRECYELPGALALIAAHKALEEMVLERDLQHKKLEIEQDWAKLVYDGLWFSPLKEAYDAFIAVSQACVTGTVRLKYYKGSCTVVGRKSPYSLYSYELATYDKADIFDRDAAKGFIDLHALTNKVWSQNRHAQGVWDSVAGGRLIEELNEEYIHSIGD